MNICRWVCYLKLSHQLIFSNTVRKNSTFQPYQEFFVCSITCNCPWQRAGKRPQYFPLFAVTIKHFKGSLRDPQTCENNLAVIERKESQNSWNKLDFKCHFPQYFISVAFKILYGMLKIIRNLILKKKQN